MRALLVVAFLAGCEDGMAVAPDAPGPPADAAPPAPGSWRTLMPLPAPRQEHAVAAIGTRVYVLGGIDGDGQTVGTVSVLDTTTGS